ncbi:methyl-accepting chemotaxis protein [Niallia sp. HCP3S3_B10]|uniref:methyl-accepting chemotaxis protein n=3 Tax=Bacillaceae TaxID=186817 RepID=UPI0004E147EA|nr:MULTISPECIES: methyl-accepting chemotaxis protein [unclassified Bacillus (in: firmicutes)]MCM3362208.1 methyl-accepting chemotaxis protein [Niallia sp. MER TA 168]
MKKILQNSMTVKKRLYASFFILLIIPTIFIGVFSYVNSKKQLEQEMMANAYQQIQQLNGNITTELSTKIEQVNKLRKEWGEPNKSVSDDVVINMLEKYYYFYDDIDSIFFATKQGQYIQQPADKVTENYDPTASEWFIAAEENPDDIYISDPYISASTNEMVVTIAGITEDRKKVIGLKIKLSAIQIFVNNITIGKEGYAFLLDDKFAYMAHPTEKIGEVGTENYIERMKLEKTGAFSYSLDNKEKKLTYLTNNLTGWKIAGSMYVEEVSDASFPILRASFFAIIGFIIIGSILIYRNIQSIIKPLNQIKEKAALVGKGDLTQELVVKRRDEIGHLTISFQKMQENLKRLIKHLEKSITQVAASSDNLTASSSSSTKIVEDLVSVIQEIASGAEHQKQEVETSTKKIKNITEKTGLIRENSLYMSKLGNSTLEKAKEGEVAINQAESQMQLIVDSVIKSDKQIETLHKRSKEVESIIQLISTIANQTNLLALNAAIEAARAGENGKGFSVVAEEIRKLAETTQKSAGEIEYLVKEIQTDTHSTVDMMTLVHKQVDGGLSVISSVKKKFHAISSSMNETAPIIDEVTLSSEEVYKHIKTLVETFESLYEFSKQNAALSEELSASTEEQLASFEEVHATAKTLAKTADHLKSFIGQFHY